LAKFGDFGGKLMQCEHSDPGRFAKISFGGGFSADGLPACQVKDKRDNNSAKN
jgi:hypothetical protein